MAVNCASSGQMTDGQARMMQMQTLQTLAVYVSWQRMFEPW